MFHKITYNTIILARRAIKFLDYILKVLAFLDYILSLAKARYKILLDKEKILSKNFITLRTKIKVLQIVKAIFKAEIQNLSFRPLYFYSFRSSLQSYYFWVTL